MTHATGMPNGQNGEARGADLAVGPFAVDPDRAFRAGMLEAMHHAETRYQALLVQCAALQAERNALLDRIARLEDPDASCKNMLGQD